MSRLLLCTLLVAPWLSAGARAADAPPSDTAAMEHFEKRVRPLLVERCYKCHAGLKAEGGLRLDSAASVQAGGDSGTPIAPGAPDQSLLIQAVRHENGVEMPPDGKLSDAQVAVLAEWIKAGAVWPAGASAGSESPAAAPRRVLPAKPDQGAPAAALQLWLRSDDLALEDGAAVAVWPDRSGHARDLAATQGAVSGGTGQPARMVKESTLGRRPAVRFDSAAGLASSANNPVAIHGDAEMSVLLVVNLQPNTAPQTLDGLLGLGNPANPTGDPGKPLAALVAVDRADDHALQFAGGWHHDASLGTGSFKPLYDRPLVLSFTKQAGPMRASTQIFLNGELVGGSAERPLVGRETVPDIQHRADMGVYMGKTLDWAGSFRGDVGEVLVYNKSLTDAERQAIEEHLAEKFAIVLAPQIAATRATFSEAERQYWAYQPVHDVPPPAQPTSTASGSTSDTTSNIDRYIQAALASKQLAPAPAADKRTLLRRVAFDLVGLPPTPEEITAFLQDTSADALAKVVDRLLASPRYGERWGRHWLDVVRYADTTANDANAVMRYSWRYRNYVIDAFNRDLPYDQFVTEQLAGDLLPVTDDLDARARHTIATGFLMVGPKALAETDKEQSRLDIVDDQLDVVGRGLLGLTVTCARCHDHKFDAIRTVDYYALAGVLRSTEQFQNEDRNASMWWQFELPQPAGAPPLVVMAPRETLPRNLRVHVRGNRFTLGPIVPRGYLQVISPDAPAMPPGGSGRLELARWIASTENPLTARVMVNRVWQHHFGVGLVATSDNFGIRGERASHPELLDWLAARFVESGWSVKALHRLIVLSSTYQQQCGASEAARQTDPDNRLLSHFSRRRLEAEELRDAVLQVSGTLDLSPDEGQGTEVLWTKAEMADSKGDVRPNRMAADDPFYTTCRRRSVYLPIVRNMLPDVLALFDAADPNAVAAVRGDTTVPSQELFLLNSPLVREQSRALAARLLADDKASDADRLAQAHLLVLGRPPRAEEAQQATDFLAAYLQAPAVQARPEAERRPTAWQSYCQALFCLNEFLYCD